MFGLTYEGRIYFLIYGSRGTHQKHRKGAKQPWAPPRLGGHKCTVQVRRDHAEVLTKGSWGLGPRGSEPRWARCGLRCRLGRVQGLGFFGSLGELPEGTGGWFRFCLFRRLWDVFGAETLAA